MNKLTAEKCREIIRSLNACKRHFGIEESTEYYLQALEIAFPILEQQERGEGEWIEWKGGECPSYCLVEFEMRDGEKHTTLGGMLDWKHESRSDDIIAYRIIPERG